MSRSIRVVLVFSTLVACSGPLPALVTAEPGCGDGQVNPGEACDDGNVYELDACTNNCEVARCGDGFKRQGLPPGSEGFEACDDGNTDDRDACTNSCELARCGDGLQRRDLEEGSDGFEICDDGNDNDFDACTRYCAPHRCGDGIRRTDLAVGHEDYEACDDGNEVENDGCRSNCVLSSCGDGVVHEGEACDDGNDNDLDGCRNDCALAVCGDGVIRADLEVGVPGFEACDDGNESQVDNCLSDCSLATCGDGFLLVASDEGPGEACDDGNAIDEDACTSECELARCGDGIQRTDLDEGAEGYEVCDDGNDDPMDGCSVQCRVDDHGDDQGSASVLSEEGGAGIIHSIWDHDYLRWSSPVPGLYRFHVESLGDSPRDLRAQLQIEGGQVLDQWDVAPTASLEVTLEANEVVFLVLMAGAGVEDGSYRIGIQTSCGNGVVEAHESCDPADPMIGTFACRYDCEWRRSLVNGWDNTCYRQEGVPWCTGFGGWLILGPPRSGVGYSCGVDGDELCSRQPIRTPLFDDGIKSMSLGNGIVCFTNIRNEPLCFGANNYGAGINGSEVDCIQDPDVRCVNYPRYVQPDALPEVDGIAVVARTLFALREGVIYSWGDTSYGLSGNNTPIAMINTIQNTPLAVDMPDPNDAVLYMEGTANRFTICALTASRRLYCWGRNGSGQTGIQPQDGDVLCPAGAVEGAGLGEDNCVRQVRIPVDLDGSVLDFSVGGDHTCALLVNGELYCWGGNAYGQLGNPVGACNPRHDEPCSADPQRVNLPDVIDIAAGSYHSCAALGSGRVACWGRGHQHQLGLGRQGDEDFPRILGRINDAREISAGVYTSCVRHQDQRISCWGGNTYGETGTGMVDLMVPFPREVLFNWSYGR